MPEADSWFRNEEAPSEETSGLRNIETASREKVIRESLDTHLQLETGDGTPAEEGGQGSWTSEVTSVANVAANVSLQLLILLGIVGVLAPFFEKSLSAIFAGSEITLPFIVIKFPSPLPTIWAVAMAMFFLAIMIVGERLAKLAG